jgi:hypothetical protein
VGESPAKCPANGYRSSDSTVDAVERGTYNETMKLALLGADADALSLVHWAIVNGHELVAAYDSASSEADLQAITPRVRLKESWEELLLASAADAVVVGRGGKEAAAPSGIEFAERRADQLRKLVQAQVPLIVVCPACEAIVGFEIEMIRRDVKGVIVPYVPGASNPALERLEEMLVGDDSPIGSVEQILLEREQIDRSRHSVLVQLARDATVLRQFIGTIQIVSASGPPAAIGRDPLGPKPKQLPPLANLSVHLGGEEGVYARWSIAPAPGANSGRLTIIGQRGKAVLDMPGSGDWSLQLPGEPPATEAANAADDAEEVFWRLTHAMATDEFYDDEAWLAACRDQEAAEAVDRSLARGRTIELFNEQHTEEASFKGIMAMGGCLLLVMALGVLFLAVVVEGLRLPMRGWPLWRLWPFYLLVPIAVFLLLQLLQLAIKRDDGVAEADGREC